MKTVVAINGLNLYTNTYIQTTLWWRDTKKKKRYGTIIEF